MSFEIENGSLKKYIPESKETEVVIPEGITSIGYSAFYGCENITSITIPDSVTKIGFQAFRDCRNLISIIIPNNVTTIEDNTFKRCKSLKSVTIPDCITSIGDGAFCGCTSLTSIIIPNSVTHIGEESFYDCSSLKSVTLPEGVKEIPAAAFSECTSLESITFCGNINNVHYSAFDGCHNYQVFCGSDEIRFRAVIDNATAVISPEIAISEIKYKQLAAYGYLIHSELFSDNVAEGYKEYIVSQSKKILPFIFKRDIVMGLKILAKGGKITVSNYEKEFLDPALESNAVNCVSFLRGWSHLNITQEAKERELARQLSKDPFNVADMKKLWKYENTESGGLRIIGYKGEEKDILIPERIGKTSVAEIGELAFDRCENITSIAIPKSIKSIGDSAFNRCFSLKSLTIPNSTVSIGKGVFKRCISLESLMVEQSNPVYHSNNNCIIETEAQTLICGCKESVIPSDGSVTIIGKSAFEECGVLSSINIPDCVTNIEEKAFYNCNSLASITVPNSVQSIGARAFSLCSSSLTVHTQCGSYGEKYCLENHIKVANDFNNQNE